MSMVTTLAGGLRRPGPRSGGRLVIATAVTIVVALATGCSPSARRVPVADLSGDQIVAKNVAARGGLDAWRKVETMVWIGHIQSTHAPLPSMQFELQQKRPNKTRMEIDAFGEKSLRVFDGVHGWKLRAGRGRPQILPFGPQELKFAEGGQGIDGPLIDAAARGHAVTLESVDEISGRQAYHLNVHLAHGDSEHVWVDAETFLDVRYDRMTDGPEGAQRRVSTFYGDYRDVDGLRVPFLIETGGGTGTTPDKMMLERVVLNAPLDDATFGNPAAPRPRGRGRPTLAHRSPAAPAPWTTPTATSEERGRAPR